MIDFDLPVGRDGFLATNSLLASVVLLARTYTEAFAPCGGLPPGLDDLLEVKGEAADLGARVAVACAPLWERATTLVLHGPGTSAVAVDLESKFNEAALGHLQFADYRNFGHGRHYWLARRGGESAVLAITTDVDAVLAERTLALLPPEVPVVRIHVPGQGARTQVGAVLASLLVAGAAGAARGIDPGRPGVPRFGSRLYRLPMGRVDSGSEVPARIPPAEAAAIERKAHASIGALHCRGELAAWRYAYRDIRKRLEKAAYGAVVFDYDGTLVDELHRRTPPRAEIVDELNRILGAGVRVGIATGRGGSARDDLRKVIDPAHWPTVTLGYYNGAEIGRLDDDARPERTDTPGEDLARVAELIEDDAYLVSTCSCTPRRWQLTVEPHMPGSVIRVWEWIQQMVRSEPGLDVAVVRSGHSIDVVPAHVSKRTLVDAIRAEMPGEHQILTIGDRGCWPGNDFALLDSPHGLSVDEVSADPGTCWNLAPRGTRGARATAAYLRALGPGSAAEGQALRFSLKRIKDE
jgi:hypothetical protein